MDTVKTTAGASCADAIALHHLAARLHRRGVPLAPRLLDHLIFLLFNSVIHHSTQIGQDTRCAYRGMSVLIHKQARIGRDVMIGPHVVIGGRSGQRGLPIIEDHAYIGANACVLGEIRIGRGAVVGAGAVVIDDVAPGAVVVGSPARAIRESGVSP